MRISRGLALFLGFYALWFVGLLLWGRELSGTIYMVLPLAAPLGAIAVLSVALWAVRLVERIFGRTR